MESRRIQEQLVDHARTTAVRGRIPYVLGELMVIPWINHVLYMLLVYNTEVGDVDNVYVLYGGPDYQATRHSAGTHQTNDRELNSDVEVLPSGGNNSPWPGLELNNTWSMSNGVFDYKNIDEI